MKPFVCLIPFSLVLAMTGCGSDEAESAAVNTSTDSCHLDFINGNGERLVHITPGQMDIRGWAFDKNTMSTPQGLEIVFKDTQGNTFSFPAASRGERPDVAKAYGQKSIENAGFRILADSSKLQQGVYSIVLKMSEGRRVVQCNIKKNLMFI
ncbi:hypothetical protein [Pseudomonas nitroreducens]|uniref:hypothetical protein n=1 Tax=Pseudomonas nitroreducens TaxID=46680 RepID=UPI0028AB9D7C|nr:hypothetical protein [Pseudomonas nitroreducens]